MKIRIGWVLFLAVMLLLAWPGKTQITPKYYYAVTAFDASNIESLFSNEVSATPLSGPTDKHTVFLTWVASTSVVAGYYVYRGTATGGPYTRISSTTLLTYTDTFPPPNPPTALAAAPGK